MKLYLGYIRVSRVGKRSETLISPELQDRAIRKWADSHGVGVDMLPPELDQSGGKDERPILQGGIEQIERGERAGVIVWNFARFTRGGLSSSIRFLEQIEGAGGELHSTSQPIDSKTPQGRMQRNIHFSIDQADREQKAEEIERSKADAIARGVWTAPVVPFGYRKRKDRRLELHPVEAPVRAEVTRLRGATGASWAQLAARIKADTGRSMLPASVSAMVKSRTALGEARQGEHFNPKAHPAIVDRATYEAAQLDNPKPPRGINGPALLIGIIRCAGCQFRMTTTVRNGVRSYGCRRHHAGGICPEPANISGHLVDPFAEGVILDRIDDIIYSASERNAALEEAESKLAEAEAELALYQESIRVADVGADHFAAGMKQRAEAVEVARRELAAAKLAAPAIPDPSTLRDLWPDLSVEERRHVLGSALSVVWVKRGRGAVADRVRLIRVGAAPDGLSVQGKPAGAPRSLAWDVDFPGEVRPTGSEDGEKTPAGASA